MDNAHVHLRVHTHTHLFSPLAVEMQERGQGWEDQGLVVDLSRNHLF